MLKQKIILVADDNIAMKNLYKTKLNRYNIITADDGARAIKMIKHEKPNLVLLDILIPEKDGYEVMLEIKKDKDEKVRNTPFFIVTNLASEQDIQEAEELGIVDYVVKARTAPEVLIEKINKYLNK
jgi:CheY-like chemotaxis protein